jgi:hypothetical protein
MLKPHFINNNNKFIAGWFINNNDLCDNLINYFENNPNKFKGKVGSKGEIKISEKDSTDLAILDFNIPIIKEYLTNLSFVIKEYQKLYIYSNIGQGSWGINNSFNIQRYLPNEGFHAWHTERHNTGSSLRHLTFMTYLNDVNDGGETEFFYQNLKIKPEKGLTIIWGTDWTFTHRGVPSPTETKYIVTGHYSYNKV